ncbi:hypothetical protein GCM10009785_22510 [Brooklawnia cerclae]|uniref:Molybdopterin converting factor small subunit n=1 Tax=Brooklawnia cerclae TaxID=349934 RepID=A0ABX0SFJ1_9ACTN|nr:MoaD/ThiS family protein [Brooklawnia cerclae]NIH57114.1 molybdopterin converting factor small subunit [Brooklawnia cerclae]
MAIVTIPSVLRTYTARQSRLTVPGATVEEVVSTLAASYPDLAPHILDDRGDLRSFVNVFVGEQDIRSLDGVTTHVDDDSAILLVPAIAGGAPEPAGRAE